MATLDKIIEMQEKGVSDTEISTQLQNEGVSPTEINDSLNQAKIKNAVSPPENAAPEGAPPQEMTSSIMSGQVAEQAPVPTPEAPAQENLPAPSPDTEYQPPVEKAQPQEDYYQQTQNDLLCTLLKH